jgi:hypothetical protein
MPSPRLFARALIAILLVGACSTSSGTVPNPTTASPSSLPAPEILGGELAQRVCELPNEWLLRIWHGYLEGRSAELQVLPKRPNFLGQGIPHAGPWDFVQDVPMFWYGPGHIEEVGAVRAPVTLADVAATQGALVGSSFQAPDGRPLTEAFVEDPSEPPRLVVTLIWDGAGRNVLALWPKEWPNLRRLIPNGAWFDNASIGSSPSSSAQMHAEIGTGAFPQHHGIVGHYFRLGGEIVKAWRRGPSDFLVPALPDVYDLETDNRAIIGMLGTVAIQMGLIGHGSAWEGGDNDLVVLRTAPGAETLGAEGVTWNLPEGLRELYRFPEYANDFPPLSSYFPEIDRMDGKADGRWRGHDFESDEVQQGFHTPARIPYQTRLIQEVIERERFGMDEVPDLLFINYKLIDEIGHRFTINNLEMKDSIRVQDQYLPVLVDTLNDQVGRGNWVLLVTADHGHTPSPDLTGAFRIAQSKVLETIQQAFDHDGDDVRVVGVVKQTEIFIDQVELREQGATLRDVAEFIMGLTQQDTYVEGEPIPKPDARVFDIAFPSEMMRSLPCLPEAREDT